MRFRIGTYVENSPAPWFWNLIFGPLYWLYKGVYSHFFLEIIVLFLTYGLGWFFYPFFANSILRKYYLRNGWEWVGE